MSDNQIGFWVSVVVVAFVAVIIGVCVIADNHKTHVECLRVSEETGRPTKTVGTSDPNCYVKLDNRWVPLESWRNIDE